MPPLERFVYLEIAEAVRRLIISGELQAGERLPSVRTMAERWHCTPNTVVRSYALLAREGLVSGHRGGGTRVTSLADRDGGHKAAPLEWAALVNRAENYLLEALSLRRSPEQAEAALAAAISRWQNLRSRGAPRETVPSRAAAELRFVGSHDLSVELLARMLLRRRPPVTMTVEFLGSLGGLMALARDEADVAGAHLWDEATDSYNTPFLERILPHRRLVLLNLAHRQLGLIVPRDNPKRLTTIGDLARAGVRIVNRKRGSGTRIWLDVQLRSARVAPECVAGYEDEQATHIDVARAVAERRADVGVGIAAAAAVYGLGFVPLDEERYDLVVPLEIWASRSVRALRAVVASSDFKAAVAALGGYDVRATGSEIFLD